jgi:uncharacterized cupredoxin-like copper-binding protein
MNNRKPLIILGVGAVALAGLAFVFVSGDEHGMQHGGDHAEAAHAETGHGETTHSETGHGATGHGDDHDAQMAIGKPAEDHDARMVTVSMKETDDGMVFEPSALTFKAGEAIKIMISNAGELEHEFVMNTPEEIIEHKTMMERFPEMEHDDPNSVRLDAGASGEIVWTFTNAGSFEFACLIPGHYEAGMHGTILVN